MTRPAPGPALHRRARLALRSALRPAARRAERRVLDLAGRRTTRLGRMGLLLSPRGGDPAPVRRLAPRTWLVGDSTTARRLAPRTWLVGDGATVRQLAPGVELVHRPRALRSRLHAVQKQSAELLALEQLLWVLRERRVECVLDVGANTGQFAKRLRRSGYRGRIESFEPVPATAARLRDEAAGDPLWRVHEVALGDSDGTATINVMAGTLSSLRDPSDYGRAWSAKMHHTVPHEISVRRLDGLWDEVVGAGAGPVFLKMDTQGFDLQVFRGAGDRVEELVGLQSEAALLTLYQDTPRLPEMLAEYERRGFATAGIFPISRDRATMRIIEVDLVMVREPAG